MQRLTVIIASTILGAAPCIVPSFAAAQGGAQGGAAKPRLELADTSRAGQASPVAARDRTTA
ncbi:MAG TPA: hypothetical protein VG916_07675, partial [Gemmatimonadaceae bacterium]|nr:hypothetical protein [Gemmatimonadaceae bacterium]